MSAILDCAAGPLVSGVAMVHCLAPGTLGCSADSHVQHPHHDSDSRHTPNGTAEAPCSKLILPGLTEVTQTVPDL